jgi:hypothetical protein
MIVTLDTKRRLTIPAALAPASPGDYFDARFDAEEDALVFRRLAGKENLADRTQSLSRQPGRCAAAPPRGPAGAPRFHLPAGLNPLPLPSSCAAP